MGHRIKPFRIGSSIKIPMGGQTFGVIPGAFGASRVLLRIWGSPSAGTLGAVMVAKPSWDGENAAQGALLSADTAAVAVNVGDHVGTAVVIGSVGSAGEVDLLDGVPYPNIALQNVPSADIQGAVVEGWIIWNDPSRSLIDLSTMPAIAGNTVKAYPAGLKAILDGTIQPSTTTMKVLLLKEAGVYDGNDTVLDATNELDNHVSSYLSGHGNAGRLNASAGTARSEIVDGIAYASIDLTNKTWAAIITATTGAIKHGVWHKQGSVDDSDAIPLAHCTLSEDAWDESGDDFTLHFEPTTILVSNKGTTGQGVRINSFANPLATRLGMQDVLDDTHDLNTGTYKLMLLKDSYVPNQDHNVVSDISAHEASGGGYTGGFGGAGRKTVSGRSFGTYRGGARMTATAPTWTALGAAAGSIKYMALIKEVTNDTLSRVFSIIYLGEVFTGSGSDYTLTLPDGGLFAIKG